MSTIETEGDFQAEVQLRLHVQSLDEPQLGRRTAFSGGAGLEVSKSMWLRDLQGA